MRTPAKITKKHNRKAPAKPVGEFIGKIIEPVLARRSGMRVDLLTAWPDLVGDQYRDFTRPEKISWPNRANSEEPFKPGVLIVACDGGKALFFQHELGPVCERVNMFFGFTAIAKIKLVQKPVGAATGRSHHGEPTLRSLDEKKAQKLAAVLDHISDPTLRQKLEKLGRGVLGKKR